MCTLIYSHKPVELQLAEQTTSSAGSANSFAARLSGYVEKQKKEKEKESIISKRETTIFFLLTNQYICVCVCLFSFSVCVRLFSFAFHKHPHLQLKLEQVPILRVQVSHQQLLLAEFAVLLKSGRLRLQEVVFRIL